MAVDDRSVVAGGSDAVEARSAELKKPLGLWDLVLMQFLSVVSTTWLGVAAKLGSSHAVFWLIAMVLFHVPLAAVVVHLSRQMPLEGGLYQWAKQAFGERLAFMVGWNLWLFSILSTALVGLQVATYLFYAFGPPAAWTTESPCFSNVTSAVIVVALAALAIIGLRASKWMHNAGGIALAVMCVVLLGLPVVHLARGTLGAYPLVPSAAPSASLLNLGILGKMGFGAFCGFEYAAILAGECRDPRRAIGRSVLLASLGVVAVYILGTASMLAVAPGREIDLVSPISQALRLGLEPFGISRYLAPAAIFVLLGCSLAGASINFTSTTRLPMVAGWDRALPGWFGRLHPRLKTPVNAILVTAAVTLGADMACIVGVKHEEAYQALLSAALIFYALSYVVMFAIPLRQARSKGARMPAFLKIAAVAGLLMTLLYVVTAVFPIVAVANKAAFSGRIVAMVACGNLAGGVLLLLSARRRRD